MRATASLRERVSGMRGKLRMMAAGKFERASLESIIDLQTRAVEKVSKAPKLSALETSDAEDELSDWLEDHGIRDGWQLAPTFVQAGLGHGVAGRGRRHASATACSNPRCAG